MAARLEEKLKGLSKERLTYKENERWSIKEHVGHLIDLEELWKMRIKDFAEKRDVLSAWDVTNRKSIEAGHNKRDVTELLAEFRIERNGILEDFAQLPESIFEWESLHPRLKIPMKIADYSHFVAEHDDHHLAWIEYLRQLD